jgi:hypothetical protein
VGRCTATYTDLPIDTIEARYPRLNYAFAPHRNIFKTTDAERKLTKPAVSSHCGIISSSSMTDMPTAEVLVPSNLPDWLTCDYQALLNEPASLPLTTGMSPHPSFTVSYRHILVC